MNENIQEYLQGLGPIADNLEKLIAGSNLSHQELGYIAYVQGYLRAAKSHLTDIPNPNKRVYVDSDFKEIVH